MLKELPGNHLNQDEKPNAELDWENYPTYRWFIGQVGGQNRMISREDGLSWMLRIYYREITDAVGTKPKMSRKTASLVRDIDAFYQYRKGDERRYGNGITSTSDANSARLFFTTTAFGPEDIGYFTRAIDAHANVVAQAAQVSPEITKALKQVGGIPGLRQVLGREYAHLYVIREIEAKFLGKKVVDFFTSNSDFLSFV